MEIRNHPDAVPFSARYPVISKNIGHYDVKDIIMKRGDEQLRKTNVKAHMTQWFMHKEDLTFAKIADQAVALATENSPFRFLWSPLTVGATYIARETTPRAMITGLILGHGCTMRMYQTAVADCALMTLDLDLFLTLAI